MTARPRRTLPTRSHVLTALAAVIIAGGIVQMITDDEVQLTALPEPPAARPNTGSTDAEESPAEVVPEAMVAAITAPH